MRESLMIHGLYGRLLFSTLPYHNPPRPRLLLRYALPPTSNPGQVEQVRDPRLQGLPFVIKQKQIVVTASYPARKLGVKKLQLWSEAKKLCPEIITIVGEDLTQYRIASREIRELVTGFVWGGKVEKLGLDELFLDVTDQINSHLEFILPLHPEINSLQTFQVDMSSHPSPRSFTYPFGVPTGFLEPESLAIQTPQIPYSTLQLFVASHFAQYIRAELFATLGYTTSAGIASSKTLAKLLSDLHKPALQSVQNPYITQDVQQSWLDTFKVEKLNGFGFRTGWILRSKLLGEEMPATGAYGDADKHNGAFAPEDDYPETLSNGQPSTAALSVGKVRTSCTAAQFHEWFGARVGPRLWSLLNGIDDEEVVPTPPFPKQISVEDSYPDNRSLPTLFNNLAILSKSLVRRLDFELVTGEGYIRFPRTLRLTMRNARLTRESKSARMPVELFDLDILAEKRVEIVGRVVNALARGMVAAWSPGWRVGVINVCATELSEEGPGKGIQGFIGRERAEEQVDWDVIRALPEDIRMEVLRQYHLSPEMLKVEEENEMDVDLDSKFEDGNEIVGMALEENEMEVDVDELDDEDDWDDSGDTKQTCSICGVRIFPWMTEAHARYHDSV
jgi:DNA polymerase iota